MAGQRRVADVVGAALPFPFLDVLPSDGVAVPAVSVASAAARRSRVGRWPGSRHASMTSATSAGSRRLARILGAGRVSRSSQRDRVDVCESAEAQRCGMSKGWIPVAAS